MCCLKVPPASCPDPSCKETGRCFEDRRPKDVGFDPSFGKGAWDGFDPAHGPFEDPGEDITSDVSELSDEVKDALAVYGIDFPDWTPLTSERKAALADIGFDEVGSIEDLTDEDAIQVLAFHKFLNEGTWKTSPEDSSQKIFEVDQTSFDYATGKLSASEYLEIELDPAKKEDSSSKSTK
jgi:hypothetical protein